MYVIGAPLLCILQCGSGAQVKMREFLIGIGNQTGSLSQPSTKNFTCRFVLAVIISAHEARSREPAVTETSLSDTSTASSGFLISPRFFPCLCVCFFIIIVCMYFFVCVLFCKQRPRKPADHCVCGGVLSACLLCMKRSQILLQQYR